MSSLVYRELQPDEAHLLGEIDRSEAIDGTYRTTNGTLAYQEAPHEAPTWAGAELAGNIVRLNSVLESGGTSFSAWDAHQLVGIGSLDVSGVAGDPTLMKLDMLYVSRAYRGRGIARKLTESLMNRARTLGATALYISATPTRSSVDVYLRLGAELLSGPDPELFAREPEDIHLLLRLTHPS